MKIGDLARTCKVSEQTIRFYIKKGLLIPQHTSYQYSFSEQDLEDLKRILSYKQLGFSLEETLSILAIYRSALPHAPKEAYYLQSLLTKKHQKLLEAQATLNQAIMELEDLIETCKEEFSTPHSVSGIHVSYLEFLACPECGGSFTLSDAVIHDSQIFSGKLRCSCGTEFSIRGGILYDEELPDIFCNTLYNEQTTLLEEYDAHSVTAIKKDEQALLRQILDQPIPENQLILETHFKRWFFLSKMANFLHVSNRYIFAESYPEIVEYHKAVFDTYRPPYKSLFLVCRPNRYPLRHGCVDIWIDYMDSVECFETEGTFLPTLMFPYLKSGGKVHGINLVIRDPKYLEDLKMLHSHLPDGLWPLVSPGSFEAQLEQTGYGSITSNFLRDIWETSAQSGITVQKNPPYRILYSAEHP